MLFKNADLAGWLAFRILALASSYSLRMTLPRASRHMLTMPMLSP